MKVLVVFLLLMFSSAYGQVSQEKLEAIFIYKFTAFITWPSTSTDQFNICVDGDAKLKQFLVSLVSQKPVKGRAAFVGSTVDDRCDLVVTGKDSKLKTFNKCRNCLHITKRSDLFSRSMIRLKVVGSKIRFDINYKFATDRRFKISSKLIKIADEVLR